MSDELSEQQKIFVIAYSAYRNASKAAREAGYKWPGKVGWELLNSPKYRNVQEAAASELADVRASLRTKRNLIVDRIYQLSFFNLAKVVGTEGITVSGIKKLLPEDQACLAAINIKEYEGGQSVMVKGYSPAPFLKILSEMAGLIGDQPVDDSRTESEIDDELQGRYSQLAGECFPDDSTPPELPAL